MGPSKIVLVVGALLALGSGTLSTMAQNGQNGQGPTYRVTLGEEGECLQEIDTARQAAGLAKFIQPTADEATKRLPLETVSNAWDPLCKDLLNPTGTKALSREDIQDFQDGTYAFEILTSGTVDCKATVDLWKGAFKNFSGLPPANTDAATVYQDKLNVSFVALYNPSTGATADCRLVTCTEIPALQKSATGDGESNRQAFIFVCMTFPDVLERDQKAPFTQEEWDRISAAITGSAAVAFPSFIVIAMTVLSIAML
ncbi:SAG family member [Eimeria maxima]|uniref:SAG family member n=1 Tax=Eimeria maxima TaxID=5804 RepID=U6M8G1_EIMMA|nr:SAG family member [Eimeria maxima]CDJ57955.1 SAG family member [Eimeria maxima]